ncbi:hypothetical protein CBS101457_004228 [Exobasidium rhododendri]|nr:hypothetical protein CBS101457_004228 [Exobasidium rhododendri]
MRSYINRNATLSWSPASLPSAESLIATGTVSGALDESFSNDSVLEIWKPEYAQDEIAKPLGTAITNARFNRLVWGYVCAERPMGVLAAGLENGELNLWDAQKIIDGADDALILRNNNHSGPIKGLHFNPKQPNLLASGGPNGEVFIWDMTNPTKPYSPGPRSSKLDEITSLSWNGEVAHILATSSTSGYTVVWNLITKKELTALEYSGGAGASGTTANGRTSGRRSMGAVCWHPNEATRIATASDDDATPVVMLWDLRNARAPEKILTGHDKGVLALSWCKQDPDLLLSCGKDNRTICWNPQTSEIVGELPPSENWSFDVQWSPKNPNLIATASFDGKIGFHSLQATNPNEIVESISSASANADDVFNSLPAQTEANHRGISLQQPPKWLRRPISASFGFGGQLVSVCNLAGEKGQTQSSVVHLRDVVTEPAIVVRAKRLQDAMESQTLTDFCKERSKDASTRTDDVANWKALQTLFQADSRDELVALLGFSKDDVASKVASAIKSFRQTSAARAPGLSAPSTPTAAPTMMMKETEATDKDIPSISSEINGTSDASDDLISELTEKNLQNAPTVQDDSLFGESATQDNGADFFNSIGGEPLKSALPSHLMDSITPSNAPSAAATTGGSVGTSSVISEGMKANTFRIYPADESDADKLITRAIVLGDFESAVSLCVSMDRFADALLLAVRGGSDLLVRTQKAYFERRTISLPYLRLFQSIVSDDLVDIVQNADLNEWQEVFVVICTFATKNEEFVSLAEQLGQRLEYQYSTSASENRDVVKTLRKNAVLCYLAAGKLEKVAGMWVDEMQEEELAIRSGQVDGSSVSSDTSLYSAHAEALQTFMEKITVFQSAVNYVDVDLAQPTQDAEAAASGARTYKLAALYDRYYEYVDLLADQGLITPALKYASQTPSDYRVNEGEAVSSLTRERLIRADQAKSGGRGLAAVNQSIASTSAIAAAAAASNTAAHAAMTSSTSAVNSAYAPSVAQVPQVSSLGYDSYSNSNNVPPSNASQPYGNNAYNSYNPGYPQHGDQQQQIVPPIQQQQQQQQQSMYAPVQPLVPAPLPPIMNENGSSFAAQHSSHFAAQATPPPPPPPKRDVGGWNDLPQGMMSAPKRTSSAIGSKTAAPITSPFPMSMANPGAHAGANMYGSSAMGAGAGQPPPPPRGFTPGARPGLTSPPPSSQQQYGRGGPNLQGPPRPPPTGPPRGITPGGNRQQSGAFAPGPGQVNAPLPPAPGQQQQPPQQQASQQQYGRPMPPQQQQPSAAFVRPPMPPMPSQHQQGAPPAQPMRAVTPGLGAGPPPQSRSATPAKAATKYPPGDRSHIPDSAKPILATLSRELARFKSIVPPSQKRMTDDADRRINLLFDLINCGTLDPKVIPGVQQLCQAIEARNQTAALGLHVQLVSISSGGDFSAALVGIKLLITKMNQ